MIKYKFYPTLLDKFQHWVDSEEEFEAYWNENTEEGGYKTSLEDIQRKNEQELLDAINRVPHEPIMVADRGTCFNEIVDCLIENRPCQREDMTIEKVIDEIISPSPFIRAEMNEFVFDFDVSTCREVAKFYEGATPQCRVEATINTAYGEVLLYGYADEVRRDVVYDIKTTTKYEFGKYQKYWQRYVYPYCLIESGDATSISSFEFNPVVISGGTSRYPLFRGQMFREAYDYNHEEATQVIRQICERFIEWLESHKELITDKKIFGGENDE